MIARLFLHLPFYLTVPEGEQFDVFEHEDSGYKIRFYPPMRSEQAPPLDGPEQFKVHGVPAFQADVLRVDFAKESFERAQNSPLDPPVDLVYRTVNSFLLRVRHVTRAPQVRQINFPLSSWRMLYLKDDEMELEENETLVRGHGSIEHSFSWIAMNNEVWNQINKLPLDYQPLPWAGLLLDANAELPNVGPSIVLTTTALEVFIAWLLDQLAIAKDLSPELWKWITQRGGHWQREPTVEEQYDVLAKFFTGHSLKEEPELWESLKNLRTARNSFVHEGIPNLGGRRVDAEKAGQLIASANQIIEKFKGWIPSALHWPSFKFNIKVEVQRRLK